MTYQKTLAEMDEDEMHSAVCTIFHTSCPFRRAREQNAALLLSWLDTLRLQPRTHRFLFTRDERGEVWLLNRRQAGCECCASAPGPVQYRKEAEVAVVTEQPRPAKDARSNQSKPRTNQDKRTEESGCCKDCCSECANICSNLLSG